MQIHNIHYDFLLSFNHLNNLSPKQIAKNTKNNLVKTTFKMNIIIGIDQKYVVITEIIGNYYNVSKIVSNIKL
jgi:hypothetical protein